MRDRAILHARSAHMQSIPPQSGVMPWGLRGYRRGKARSLRSRACGLGYRVPIITF
jgi:hypothetical protein